MKTVVGEVASAQGASKGRSAHKSKDLLEEGAEAASENGDRLKLDGD